MSDPRHIVTVGGVFYSDQGKVLLVKTPRRGWEYPGGQVEPGEDLLDALAREVREESACEVEAERLVGVYTNPAPPEKVLFLFVGRHVSGVPQAGHESVDAGWFTVEEALKMVTFPANLEKLKDALHFQERLIYRVYTTRPYAVKKRVEL